MDISVLSRKDASGIISKKFIDGEKKRSYYSDLNNNLQEKKG
jgi:hypothetical protein